MIMLPISEYPASSDDSSQIQVLSERRGEISEDMQNVDESRLDSRAKSAVTQKLQSESAGLAHQIQDKKDHSNYTKSIDSERKTQESVEQKALSKRREAAKEGRLDVKA